MVKVNGPKQVGWLRVTGCLKTAAGCHNVKPTDHTLAVCGVVFIVCTCGVVFIVCTYKLTETMRILESCCQLSRVWIGWMGKERNQSALHVCFVQFYLSRRGGQGCTMHPTSLRSGLFLKVQVSSFAVSFSFFLCCPDERHEMFCSQCLLCLGRVYFLRLADDCSCLAQKCLSSSIVFSMFLSSALSFTAPELHVFFNELANEGAILLLVWMRSPRSEVAGL